MNEATLTRVGLLHQEGEEGDFNPYSTGILAHRICIRWFKYDRDYLCVNKSQLVPVIFEPPCKIVF